MLFCRYKVGNQIFDCLWPSRYHHLWCHSLFISWFISNFAQLIGGGISILFWIFFVPSFAWTSAYSLPLKSEWPLTHLMSTLVSWPSISKCLKQLSTVFDFTLMPVNAAMAAWESEKIVTLLALQPYRSSHAVWIAIISDWNTVRPQDTRPQAARTSTMHIFE